VQKAIQRLLGLGLMCSGLLASAAPLASLEFASAGDSVLTPAGDGGNIALGAMTAGSTPGHAFADGIYISDYFTLTIRADGASHASVTVRQTEETAGCTIRINGQVVPYGGSVLVDTHHLVGVPVVHTVEILAPRDVDAGGFLSYLEWLVETDNIN
jgi:hypothetical protein